MKPYLNIILLSVLLAACTHSEHHGEEAEEHEHEHEGMIVLSAKQQEADGVLAETLQPGTFHEVLHTAGRIVGAPGSETRVAAPVSGIVSGLKVTGGCDMKAGQALLAITAVPSEQSSATIELEAARTALSRLERLAADKLVNAEELEAARTRMRQAENAVKAQKTTVAVPNSGTLQTLAVANGEYVEAGTQLATITKGGNLRLEADIPERYNGHAYTAARFRFAGRTYTASRQTGCTTVLDDNGCTRVTMEGIAGEAPLPHVGAFCEVWLSGPERSEVLALPLTALTEDQGTYYIYIKEDDDCFRRQAVTLGESDGERVEVISGAKAGDMVVTSGTYAVRAAGNSNAVPGHTHNH